MMLTGENGGLHIMHNMNDKCRFCSHRTAKTFRLG